MVYNIRISLVQLRTKSQPHTSCLANTDVVQKLSVKQQPCGRGIQDDRKSPLGCTDCISEMDNRRGPKKCWELDTMTLQPGRYCADPGSKWREEHKMAATASLHLCTVGGSLLYSVCLDVLKKDKLFMPTTKYKPSNSRLCCYHTGNWL